MVAHPETSDPWIGRVLADTYQITAVLGEGGMGRIFAARHLRLRDRHVAVKVLSDELAGEPEILARFEQEVETVSRVVHPHVIELYDAGHTADGTHFFVTELLEGEDLGARLAQSKPLPLEDAVTIARQTCLALAAAHAHGVVHRDVKPDNLFITEVDGHPFVKVLDFGISKMVTRGSTKLTRAGAVLGTPEYMAPEQARGTEVDQRADVYGLGATLYKMLAGRSPWGEGEDPAVALSKLLSEEPPRLRSVESSVPAELEVIVQRAMAKEPPDRYSSVLELEAALAHFAESRLTRSTEAILGRAPTIIQGLPEAPQGARMAVVFYAALLGVFWIGGASTGAAALVRAARHSTTVSSTDSFLVLAGVGLATFLLSASVLNRTREAWPNSVRVLELVADRRRALFMALAVYAFGALAVRFAVTFLVDDAASLDVFLDVGVFLTSMAAAVVVAALAWLGRLVGRFRRRRV